MGTPHAGSIGRRVTATACLQVWGRVGGRAVRPQLLSATNKSVRAKVPGTLYAGDRPRHARCDGRS
eukprot:7119143-Prymnesium_polylepis.1